MVKIDKGSRRDVLKIQIENLKNYRNKLQEIIKDFEKNIYKLESEIRELEDSDQKIKEQTQKLRKKREHIMSLLLEPLDFSKIDEKITKLQNHRIQMQTLADLYYIALESINDGNSTCPLCGVGKVGKERIKKELKTVKENISKIEEELRNLGKFKDEMINRRKQLELEKMKSIKN